MENEFFTSYQARQAGVIDGIDDVYSASRKVAAWKRNQPKASAKGFALIAMLFFGLGASAVSFVIGITVANESLIATGVLWLISGFLSVATVKKFVKEIQVKPHTR